VSSATYPVIEEAIRAVVKKSVSAVGRLADPKNGSWAVYELARTSLSFIVGTEALHDYAAYKTEEQYNKALDSLSKSIDEALSR